MAICFVETPFWDKLPEDLDIAKISTKAKEILDSDSTQMASLLTLTATTGTTIAPIKV